ncbi:MAG: B12-binding domain-containing radical SAM protein [Desulfovibrionales bacterium]
MLGIAPWIHDFAAFNLWSRPVGLLSCLDMLGRSGCSVALVDCLDCAGEDSPPGPRRFGAGPYPKVPISKPPCLSAVPRTYSRYGLPRKLVRGTLERLTPPPDLILVSAAMTYWYPGAFEALEMARDIWPRVPLVLGGPYATLCTGHAKANAPADCIISGPLEREDNWEQLWQTLGQSPPKLPDDAGFGLALNWYGRSRYAPLLLSRGCPFSCAYCAGKQLYPGFATADPQRVFSMMQEEYGKGVRDFAFYDDALLIRPERCLIPLLDDMDAAGMRVRLHTPNALHVRELTLPMCSRLKRAGLTTIRLGLETADFGTRLDSKLSAAQWEQGTENLLRAGFHPREVGVYVLFGLPDQDEDDLLQTISFVKKAGFTPFLAQYTPIPGTPLFEKACGSSPYPLREEPLVHNNSIWPSYPGGFTWKEHTRWRDILAR